MRALEAFSSAPVGVLVATGNGTECPSILMLYCGVVYCVM